MSSKPVSDDSFETDVLAADSPVLVDFWAEWCGPCKQIGPSLEEISDEMGDALIVAKVNIDENPMTPSKYGVRGIPTLMLFKDGEVAATKVGALPKGKLVEWIQSAIKLSFATCVRNLFGRRRLKTRNLLVFTEQNKGNPSATSFPWFLHSSR